MTSVQLLNPYIDKDALTDKMSVLDIVARTDQAMLIDIETQIRNTGEMREQSLYYWTKLYESQLHEGETYHTLHPAIAINVLDFVEIPNDRVHNVFQLCNQDGVMLTDHLTIHFLELPKLAQGTPREQSALILVKGDPIMEKALNTLEFLSHDEQTRQRYEARQKALHDYATAIETAKRAGREEGKEDMVRRMLVAGLPIEQIAAITGLPIADITALQHR